MNALLDTPSPINMLRGLSSIDRLRYTSSSFERVTGPLPSYRRVTGYLSFYERITGLLTLTGCGASSPLWSGHGVFPLLRTGYGHLSNWRVAGISLTISPVYGLRNIPFESTGYGSYLLHYKRVTGPLLPWSIINRASLLLSPAYGAPPLLQMAYGYLFLTDGPRAVLSLNITQLALLIHYSNPETLNPMLLPSFDVSSRLHFLARTTNTWYGFILRYVTLMQTLQNRSVPAFFPCVPICGVALPLCCVTSLFLFWYIVPSRSSTPLSYSPRSASDWSPSLTR